MKKREQKKQENDQILTKLIENIETLWKKGKVRIIEAKDGNENKRISIRLAVVIDTSASVPSVGTVLGFTVNSQEDGASVTKRIKMAIAGEAENPGQTQLFSAEETGGPRVETEVNINGATPKKKKLEAKAKKKAPKSKLPASADLPVPIDPVPH